MNKEQLKRIPIVAFFYRLFHPGYSSCGICGLPWSNCKSHTVEITKTEGFFPVCEYCWKHSNISTIQKACTDLHKFWEKQGPPPYSLEQMHKAVKDSKTKEYDDALYKCMSEYFKEKNSNILMVNATFPNLKWKINEKLAKENGIYCLSLIDVDDNNTILKIDVDQIPRGYNVENFIDYIQKKGIAFVDSFKEKPNDTNS